MRFLKHLLLPLQILYSLIILLRNQLYDLKITSIYNSQLTTISIGNLRNGGTGKTPMVEYLINLFENKKIAILSRGYKRKTKGFIIGNNNHSSEDIGDENFQLYNKFKNIIIACDENRVHGIKQLETENKELDFVILDDGFQHRSLHRDIDILLTEYNNLFSDDQLMPIGKLREHKSEMKRSHIIVITKCPMTISKKMQDDVIKKIRPSVNQKIFFSYIRDYRYISMKDNQLINLKINEKHILITGIANTKPLLKFLNDTKIKYHHLSFQDHYNFQHNVLLVLIVKY